jgi:hypothetical protein
MIKLLNENLLKLIFGSLGLLVTKQIKTKVMSKIINKAILKTLIYIYNIQINRNEPNNAFKQKIAKIERMD